MMPNQPRWWGTLFLTLFLTLCLTAAFSLAQAENVAVTFLVRAPHSTAGLPIYLAGNFQGWNPGQRDFRLKDLGQGSYRLTVLLPPGRPIQFKFTRGDWSKVEKGPAGQEISNRVFQVLKADTLRCRIAAWADDFPALQPPSTRSGDIRPLKIPGLFEDRSVLVFLPPGYDRNPDQRYPVLYMFDGQNVFDAATSFAGEWRVDETVQTLVGEGKMQPIIVVGVANGGARRSWEYTPWPDPHFSQGKSGGGQEHLDLLVKQLVPAVNRTFRTLSGPRHTALAGSSFGGLMTLYAAGELSDTFGLFAALSPSLGWANHRTNDFARRKIRPGIRLYVDMGGRESDDPSDASLVNLRELAATLKKKGFIEGQDLLVVEDPPAHHNERAWSRRFPAALEFLFPPERQKP